MQPALMSVRLWETTEPVLRDTGYVHEFGTSNVDPAQPADGAGSDPPPAEDPWQPCSGDANLSLPPTPGSPGNTPPGEDLNLRIGWERFEKLILAVSRSARGLRGIKFRRYGVQGQAQHGIDLAGREPDGSYTVIQCKDYQEFTTGDLRNAVTKFTTGKRPFDAHRFIVATSAATQRTELQDELAVLQDAHSDLELDLWDSEQINEYLRSLGDVVARFWTRETAETFCTAAPPPSGVPVPLPDRQAQAEKILIGPLKTNDVAPILQRADAQRSSAPADSAQLYGDLATRLHDAGFRGHAVTMRRKQLEALADAQLSEQAVELAARLAVTALHFGDRDEARRLAHQIESLVRDGSGTTTNRHAQLVSAAVQSVLHPLGVFDTLREALNESAAVEPDYQPLLVLLLAERMLALESESLNELDPLIGAAIVRADAEAVVEVTEDAAIRLRLVRAEYNASERTELDRLARRHLLPARQKALVRAREARRCTLESRAEEALEAWRDAVHDAIHAGLPQDAADWLYAIRAVNVQFGPMTSDIDDEHRLAQALRATETGRLLSRVRSPREHALSALVSEKPIEAALSAQRWLTETVTTGSWASEIEALEFLADLYRKNAEPMRAALFYQRAGKSKKLTSLADTAGDAILPIGSLKDAPWWVAHARASLIETQADLIDDSAAQTLLSQLTDLAERGRQGELVDSRYHNLTHQVTRSACVLVARGTQSQAIALLGLLASDVPRGPNKYRHSDDCHATACVAIAKSYPALANTALTRLFDLADGGVQKALELITDDDVINLLTGKDHGSESLLNRGCPPTLSEEVRAEFRSRVIRLDEDERYLADVLRFRVDPDAPSVRERANQARDRILLRPAPEPHRAEIGTRLVTDAYLACNLDHEEKRICLEKLMNVAGDVRELAISRQDALTGARNLVIDMPPEIKEKTFNTVRTFVLGEQDGSHLDDELAGKPHPLSSFKISMGSPSLRGSALQLAAVSASTTDDHAWVRDQAVALLRSDDTVDIHAAAVTLSRLPSEVAAEVDANLMAVHNHVNVRQASAFLCMQEQIRYRDTAMRLARDGDFRVRKALAEAAVLRSSEEGETASVILTLLSQDPRHSVRAAARRT